MRVSRIEVFGFKSFMERLVLPLEEGVTGVVGPNGCGKSNIVDALRWVLGETRASQLRGGVLEDVIFNGTDKLRPLGLAEVTITLRSSEKDFYAELTSLAKASETPLSSDGKEIIETEKEGDELARPRFTIVQGALSEELQVPVDKDSSIPQEEPNSLDQATAEEIPQSNQDAVSKNSETMLSRFSWLRSLTEVQVTRRLYRSGESEYFINRTPCRLKDLKELFRVCGLGPRAYTIVAQGEVARIVTAKPEERRLILEDAAGVLGFREKIQEAERRLGETTQSILRLSDIEKELGRQVASLKRQANKAIARKEIKEELSSLEQALFCDSSFLFEERQEYQSQALEESRAKEVSGNETLQALSFEENACRGEMSQIDTTCDGVRNELDRKKENLYQRQRARSERQSKLNEVKAFASARETELKRLEERQGVFVERREQTLKEIEHLEAEDVRLNQQIQQGSDQSEEELRIITGRIQELRGKLREKEQAVRESREKLSSNQGSLNTIQDQLVAASPLTQLSKTLGSDTMRRLGSEVSVLIDGLKIPEEHGRSVQAILAERARFLVAEDPHSVGAQFLHLLQQRGGKDQKGFGLGVLRAGETSPQETVLLPEFPRMIDVIEVAPKYRLAASLVFHQVYLTPSGEFTTAFLNDPNNKEIVQSLSPAALFVTPEGDIISPHSFYSLRHEGGLVQLKLKQVRLLETVEELSKKVKESSEERDLLQKELSQAEARHGELLREIQTKQAALREIGRQQGSIRGRIHGAKRQIEQIDSDRERAIQQVNECRTRMEEFQKRATEIQIDIDRQQDEISDQSIQEEINTLTQDLQKAEATRREGRTRLDTLSRKLGESRRELDGLRKRIAEAELELRKIELESENLRTRIVDEYGEEEFQRLVALITEHRTKGEGDTLRLSPEVRNDQSQRVAAIRQRIHREGDVDPSSIELYEEESKRLEPLQSQREDLECAQQMLNNSIERLRATSVERFLQTFESVRANFTDLVPRLFGGGKADLELSTPESPLNSGVEIVVRPPGKKPKSIELLSGGEKALCATALIFSMFLERPSPLCVLDEVDAPLDEANLLRFLSVIQEMSTHTQFLMITHNKQSMTIANNLVGVTMQEPGASRMISVSLNDAMAKVA